LAWDLTTSLLASTLAWVAITTQQKTTWLNLLDTRDASDSSLFVVYWMSYQFILACVNINLLLLWWAVIDVVASLMRGCLGVTSGKHGVWLDVSSMGVLCIVVKVEFYVVSTWVYLLLGTFDINLLFNSDLTKTCSRKLWGKRNLLFDMLEAILITVTSIVLIMLEEALLGWSVNVIIRRLE